MRFVGTALLGFSVGIRRLAVLGWRRWFPKVGIRVGQVDQQRRWQLSLSLSLCWKTSEQSLLEFYRKQMAWVKHWVRLEKTSSLPHPSCGKVVLAECQISTPGFFPLQRPPFGNTRLRRWLYRRTCLSRRGLKSPRIADPRKHIVLSCVGQRVAAPYLCEALPAKDFDTQ